MENGMFSSTKNGKSTLFLPLNGKIFLPVLFLLLLATQSIAGKFDLSGCFSDRRFAGHRYPFTQFDSLPTIKGSHSIRKITGDQDIYLQMENGEISRLEINGKTIDKEDYGKYQQYIDEVQPGNAQGTGQSFWFNLDLDNNPGSQQGIFFRMDSLMKEFPFGDNSFSFGTEGHGFPFGGTLSLDSLLSQMPFFSDDWQEDFHYPNPTKGGSGQFNSQEGVFPDNQDEYPSGDAGFDVVLGNALNKDGLLMAGEENAVELTYSSLKINGKKQAENIFQKYKRIFEESSGTILQKGSRIKFTFVGKESSRKFRVY